MAQQDFARELFGRRAERARLEGLVDAARLGHSGVLVLQGEPGIGKSALLAHLAATATGCRVLRVTGVESEMELAFAGLHQLCRPLLDALPQLPAPQANALRAAFGLTQGEPPNKFLVGLAALSLLSEGARDRPLLCLVDDAQWLDRASATTFAFVARRLEAESVVLVIARRAGDSDTTWAGLPELTVTGLDPAAAQALLDQTLPGPLDERVRARLLAETRGNPLALLMLPRWFSAGGLAFGPPPASTDSVATRIREGVRRELDPLPPDARRLLLLAAADPVGDPALLWRAAERLGIDQEAATAALATDLLEVRDAVVFRHPLVRSVVYEMADAGERRAVHGALAEATDPTRDPDRRAWHRARAAAGPDEAVAAELERSAERALAQGGFTAAAAFLDRAAALTPDATARTRRQLAAAESLAQAGAFAAALETLGHAQAGPLSDLQRGKAALLRARVCFASRRGGEPVGLLVEAARQLERLDVELAADSYIDALTAAVYSASLADGCGAVEVARAVRRAPMPSPSRRNDVLLKAVAALHLDGYAAAAPALRDAVSAYDHDRLPTADCVRSAYLAAAVASALWDDRAWERLTAKHLQKVRDAGALSALPQALNSRVVARLFAGDLAGATRLAAELEAAREALEPEQLPYGAVALAAFRGDEAEARSLIDGVRTRAAARREGVGLSFTRFAEGVLANGASRYRRALEACRGAVDDPEQLAIGPWTLAELVEAAVREGEADTAAAARAKLDQMARASGTDWALGVAARAEAQLRDGDAADDCYREAIDRLGRTSLRPELARARLLYGEWLRRSGRRREARDQLRTAYEALAGMGMHGFAERARRELASVGETLRRRPAATRHELTAQELRIARLAAAGLTNSDIAAELYLSPRTVEWHLRKVFSKLDVSSRRQLRHVFGPALTSA